MNDVTNHRAGQVKNTPAYGPEEDSVDQPDMTAPTILPSLDWPLRERLLLTRKDVSWATGLSPAKVSLLIASGELPSVAIGRSRRVETDALRAWIARL